MRILDRYVIREVIPPFLLALLVLASDIYDEAEYIRDYDQFLRERRALDAAASR